MPLTHTWRHRLALGGGLARRAAMTVALTACTVVAISTIWGWFTREPLDVAGPARSAVNRTALVGSFAQSCLTRWLTATQSDQQTLHDCWSLRDPIRLPTTPAAVISASAVSAVTLVEDTGAAQQWSVVVAVSERPYASASPRTAFYRLPVLYSSYGVRASALPARINGPGAGADAPLGYPVAVATTSSAFTTVAGFLTSYLTAAGGLERYVTPDSGLVPIADYRSATVTELRATHAVDEHTTPAENITVHVLAAVTAQTSQFAPRHEQYPIALSVRSGRWTVSALDYAPRLAPGAELTPVIPAPVTAPR